MRQVTGSPILHKAVLGVYSSNETPALKEGCFGRTERSRKAGVRTDEHGMNHSRMGPSISNPDGIIKKEVYPRKVRNHLDCGEGSAYERPRTVPMVSKRT